MIVHRLHSLPVRREEALQFGHLSHHRRSKTVAFGVVLCGIVRRDVMEGTAAEKQQRIQKWDGKLGFFWKTQRTDVTDCQ